MNILCIHFGVSNRILAFINHINKNKKYNIKSYNVFNKSDFKNLKNSGFKMYDGIILLGIGNQNTYYSDKYVPRTKCSIKCLKKDHKEVLNYLITLIELNSNTPILGVCYGAMILNYYYGGSEIIKPDAGIQGFLKTTIDKQSPLFKNIEGEFYPQYNHNYVMIHDNSKVIAFNESSQLRSGYQFSKNHYGISFHLINSDSKCEKIIDNFFDIVEKRKPISVLIMLLLLLMAIFLLKIVYKVNYPKNFVAVILICICINSLFV